MIVAEITFLGAAGTVTGSKHLVASGSQHFLVDCGLFQGTQNVVALNEQPLPVAPSSIGGIVLTHGHIDHVGYLPKIVHDGYAGPIYCTPATAGVLQIVLEDAAHLQGHLRVRGFQNERPHAPPPFYEMQDVAATLELVQAVPYEQDFSLCSARLRFRNAGHILGSAFIDATIEGKRVFFSGDLGRYSRPLLYDPADPAASADVIVCESTYGDRLHPPEPLNDLKVAIDAAVLRGGPLVMPAFAVERTQDMLYAIGQLQAQDPQVAGLPVHLDSPMAIKVDALFAEFPDEHRPFANEGGAPFGCRNLTVHVTTEESKALNDLQAPAIVIAASGMAAGGRVLHHLHNQLPNAKATVLFVGYQGAGTLGSALLGGARTVRIYGDQVPVQAQVASIKGYSAHADQNELLRWLSQFQDKPRMYAVHGEPASAEVLDAVVRERLGFATQMAQRGTTVTV
ncbi:MAG: MBL fold metallo-hydrolase [Candidatus Meridianibacter frigidus]|nr:MAG: MBL fold metallo-hydrolase [Candidatus Eremiobacteraeota bacterium]